LDRDQRFHRTLIGMPGGMATELCTRPNRWQESPRRAIRPRVGEGTKRAAGYSRCLCSTIFQKVLFALYRRAMLDPRVLPHMYTVALTGARRQDHEPPGGLARRSVEGRCHVQAAAPRRLRAAWLAYRRPKFGRRYHDWNDGSQSFALSLSIV